ncbi:MAG TPA: 23S rRNA (pseudouridine(1915)-N(3))-methyltransferase RlmH [Candidatus Saccharimonadales bacterium]|jgi:23S rRNA (pseudouridine1915-N3)-methyltransferase
MKLHIITVGEPKLAYARLGWEEYIGRLKHYHTVRTTHVADKHNDSGHLLAAAGQAYKVALVIDGLPGIRARQYSSPELAAFIGQRNQDGREAAFLIGGPDGLPDDVIARCDLQWSFSRLTFPHDLAMLILAETLYRASTIAAGQPYHR